MLNGSHELHEGLSEHLDGRQLPNDERAELAAVLCGLSFEHAKSIVRLIEQGHASSALALVRVQFEALVRAFWIRFCATDERIAKAVADVPSGAKEPDVFPSVSDMMKHLDGKAPPAVVGTLSVYMHMAWGAMNSFTHGSLRPMRGFRNGYPPQLLSQVIQNANGVMMLAAMLVAELTQDQDAVNGVLVHGRRHGLVLPPLQPNAPSA